MPVARRFTGPAAALGPATMRRSLSLSEEVFQERLQRIRQQLPAPVFWLLGKAQSGKTAIVRALTGSTRAEIGQGYRPCTRHSRLYPFPNDKKCFLQFLDTRGLGEVAYDPHEDLRVAESQAHCVIVVAKAMDFAQECVLAPLAQIRHAHPDWPIIVAQTCLHEGYPPEAMRHVLPYPFDRQPWPPSVPRDLARALLYQREVFGKLAAPGRFVPIDFTLPEDGFEPEHYGLESLWQAIEEALPSGLWSMLRADGEARQVFRDAHFRAARPHILFWAMAAGASALVPVPMVDVPAFLAIQAMMYRDLASVYGQATQAARLPELLGTLGLGFLLRRVGGLAARDLLKVVPGLGSAVSAAFAAASTYALGHTLCEYFSRVRHGDMPDKAQLRRLYDEQFAQGRRYLERYQAPSDRQKEGLS